MKQSGGHGQFAICEIEVEPLPGGSGIEFVDKVVGGAVPRQFIPSVEKGVRAQAAKGVAAGYPLIDVRITLLDGKAHSVDSSDAAFQTAGALALREAAADARIHLLEPVAEVSVLVGDEYVGAVMSDLSGRRGRVVGTEQAGGGRTLVRAEVPRDRDRPVRRRSALPVPRHRALRPLGTRGTSRCRPRWPRRSANRRSTRPRSWRPAPSATAGRANACRSVHGGRLRLSVRRAMSVAADTLIT